MIESQEQLEQVFCAAIALMAYNFENADQEPKTRMLYDNDWFEFYGNFSQANCRFSVTNPYQNIDISGSGEYYNISFSLIDEKTSQDFELRGANGSYQVKRQGIQYKVDVSAYSVMISNYTTGARSEGANFS